MHSLTVMPTVHDMYCETQGKTSTAGVNPMLLIAKEDAVGILGWDNLSLCGTVLCIVFLAFTTSGPQYLLNTVAASTDSTFP